MKGTWQGQESICRPVSLKSSLFPFAYWPADRLLALPGPFHVYHLNLILDYNQLQLFLTLKIYFDQIYTLAYFEKKSDCLGVEIPAVNIFKKVSDTHPIHTMHIRERCLFP